MRGVQGARDSGFGFAAGPVGLLDRPALAALQRQQRVQRRAGAASGNGKRDGLRGGNAKTVSVLIAGVEQDAADVGGDGAAQRPRSAEEVVRARGQRPSGARDPRRPDTGTG